MIKKSRLKLSLNLAKGTLNDSELRTRDISNIGHPGNGDYEVLVEKSSDLPYVVGLIRQAYERN